MEEKMSNEDTDKEKSQDGLTTRANEGKLDIKKIISLSNKNFANTIINTLTTYIDIAERVDEEYKKAAGVIAQIEHFYNKEKDTFAYYKRLLAEGRLTTQEINYHASDIQDDLEVFEENFAELVRISRTMTGLFSHEEDRCDYDNKIDGACTLFNQIYQDIEDIAFEEQNLAKTL